MARSPMAHNWIVCFAGVWLLAISGADAAGEAERILDAAGVKGGLVVDVGCGDGKLTAALRANESYLVHGLDTDAKNVAKARAYIQSLGLYGPVSVDTFDGRHLPYADNLVNLLVISGDGGQVSRDEMLRVLCPGGVAFTANPQSVPSTRDGPQLTKSWPDDIDEWTHYLHDADGNAVANDRVVGQPRHLQWMAKPYWSRHHDTVPSVTGISPAALVTFSATVHRSWSVSLAASPVTPRATRPLHPTSRAFSTSRGIDSVSTASLSSKGVASIQCIPLKSVLMGYLLDMSLLPRRLYYRTGALGIYQGRDHRPRHC